MKMIASWAAVLEAGVPGGFADDIHRLAVELLDLPARGREDRVVVLVGDSPYAEAVRAAAGQLAETHEVVLCGPGTLDDAPSARLVIEALGSTALSDRLIDYFDDARPLTKVLSVGVPAGVDPDRGPEIGVSARRVVEQRGRHAGAGEYAFVRLPEYVTADVTLAAHTLVSSHALNPACGQVIVGGGGGVRPDLLGQYARYNRGAHPLVRPLETPAPAGELPVGASVAVEGEGAGACLRAEAALRAGASEVVAGADVARDVPGVQSEGRARVRVVGDEIHSPWGRALIADGLSRDEAIERAVRERAVVVVPGERTVVVQPLRDIAPDVDGPRAIWTVHDAGVPWVAAPGGRDILVGAVAASVARVGVSMESFLADRPRVNAEYDSVGYGPDEGVGLYALAAGIAADGAPTTAIDILQAFPAAWREAARRSEEVTG